ncbi:MAG: glycosyltransferase [Saprospiraceae bacterium]|nr:glycosyltransferase family 4 protein [Bacteroidia bacterium]NNL91124.1 glycosyltransferase [Saprospiraceae bacterium]
MKILQLVKKFPNPPKDGESIAVLSSSRGYAELGCEVTLLSMNTKKHFADVSLFPEGISHYKNVITSFLDNSISPVKAFFNLFKKTSYNIERFDDDAFRQKLIKLLSENKFDVIQLESLYMAPYIDILRTKSEAIIVMRSHNHEYEIWKNLSESNTNPLLKWYYNLCSKRLYNYELNQFDKYDLLLPISHTDYSKYIDIGYHGDILLSPVGIDIAKYEVSLSKLNPSIKLGYIGSLDWKPNIEGLKWFFNTIWKPLADTFENLEFHLAGRNPDPSLKEIKYKNVVYHGEVSSAKNFLENLDIIVVPLLSGSGIRIKILESMAMGKVVLSTKKGFEGISISNGVEGFIFESFEEFEKQIKSLLQDPNKLIEVSEKAKNFILNNFEFKKLAEKNIEAFNSFLNK